MEALEQIKNGTEGYYDLFYNWIKLLFKYIINAHMKIFLRFTANIYICFVSALSVSLQSTEKISFVKLREAPSTPALPPFCRPPALPWRHWIVSVGQNLDTWPESSVCVRVCVMYRVYRN